MKSNLLLPLACLYTTHATWYAFLVSGAKTQKSWVTHVLFHSNFFPQKIQRLLGKINVSFKPFRGHSVLHFASPFHAIIGQLFTPIYLHLFINQLHPVKRKMQKEIRISYHRHLDFKAQLQVARWQLGISSWEQVKAKAPPSQEMQGRDHRSSPRGHTGDESILFMYNVSNCMFHHKH